MKITRASRPIAGAIILVLSGSSVPISSLGTTHVVPTNYPTIQAAIWASSAGDTVLVLPGIYVENVVIDRQLVVRSAQGPQVTVIDGSAPDSPDSASVVRMSAGRIEGISIQNGSGTLDPFQTRLGGGILVTGIVEIVNNWIHANALSGAHGAGAGIYLDSGIALVARNRIFDNRIDCTDHGFAAAISGWGAAVINNEIFDNHVVGGSNGGVHTHGPVHGNTFACNSADGSSYPSPCSALSVIGDTVQSNTVVANWTSELGSAVLVYTTEEFPETILFGNNIAYNLSAGVACRFNRQGDVSFACNNFFGNTAGTVIGNCSVVIGEDGNIAMDPLFGRGNCPDGSNNWCLGADSPLLPANSPPGCGLIGALGECPPIAVPEVDLPRPSVFWALDPRPNPFAVRTEIPFHLGEPAAVEVAIYGVMGRKVRTLGAAYLGAGDHELVWDARDGGGRRAAAGGYVAVIRAGSREVTRTLLLIP